MRIKIMYYELKEKEFRKKTTLTKFLKSNLPSAILRVSECKGGITYPLDLREFIEKNRK